MAEDSRKLRLGDILIKNNWITKEHLEEALRKQQGSREMLGKILLKNGYVKEEHLMRALSAQFGIPAVSLKNFYVDWKLVMRFSASLLLDHRCFPLRQGEDSVTIGIDNPLDAWALQQLETETKGDSVKLVLVTASAMSDLLERYKKYINIKIRHSLDGKKE